MKGSTIMWLEGFLRLRREGKKLLRTVHLSFVPDEEIGGIDGMAKWVNESSFAALRVGLALDEGLASGSDDPALVVFYGERAPWWVEVKAEGPTGHGSRFVENPATHRLLRTVAKFLSYRDTEEARLEAGKSCGATLGDVTTINLTVLSAGSAVNVVPSQATAAFDIRIPPHVDLVAFRALLDEWTSEEGVSYRFIQHTPANPW